MNPLVSIDDCGESLAAAFAQSSFVYVPPGVWTVPSTVQVPAGAHLIVDGTLKLAANVNATMLRLAGDGIVIEGAGALDGNRAAQSEPCAGIDTAQVAHIRVRDITITNFAGWPVNIINSSSDVRLSGLTLSKSGAAPEFANNCTDCWADRLSISGIDDYGFCFYGGVRRSGLTNSTIEDCLPGFGVLADSAQPWACSDITFAHNVVYVPAGTTEGNVEAVYLVNNTGTVANNHSDICVLGNTFHGSSSLSGGQAGGVGTFAALVAGADDSLLEGNNFHDLGAGRAIVLSSARTKVLGNRCRNIGVGGERTAVGIYLNGAHGCAIDMNEISDTQAVKTLAYAFDGRSGGNNKIRNNDVSGASALCCSTYASGPGDIWSANISDT